MDAQEPSGDAMAAADSLVSRLQQRIAGTYGSNQRAFAAA
jgi:hypothetical protein